MTPLTPLNIKVAKEGKEEADLGGFLRSSCSKFLSALPVIHFLRFGLDLVRARKSRGR